MPGGINPIYRISQLGWVTLMDTIEVNQTNFVVDYNYLSPLYYLLKPLFTVKNDYFIIETRGRTGFDLYTPYYNNFSQQDGALLIWRNNVDLIPADNDLGIGWVNDFFPTTGLSSQDWNDETVPSSKLLNGNFSHIALQNIVWNYETDSSGYCHDHWRSSPGLWRQRDQYQHYLERYSLFG